MTRYRGWIVAGVLALAAWGAYALVARRMQVPDTAGAVVRRVPSPEAFGKMAPGARREAIARVSEGASRLPFTEREALGRSPEIQAFIQGLDEEERLWYVKQVMPRRLKEALERFSRQPPGERARIVEQAVQALRRRPEGWDLGEEAARKAREDLSRPDAAEAYRALMRFYLSETTPRQKSELAPLVREVATQYQQAAEGVGGK